MFGHARARVTVFLTVTFVVLSVGAGAAQALMVKMPVAKVTSLSRTVVVGDVVSVQARRIAPAGPGDRGSIETVVKVRVTKALKGLPRRTITVHVPGGTIGNESLVVEDAPVFVPGGRYITFLDGRGGVTAWRQGAIPVVNGRVPAWRTTLKTAEKRVTAIVAGDRITSVPAPVDAAPLTDVSAGSTGDVVADDTQRRVARATSTILSDGFESGMTNWTLSGTRQWGSTTYRAQAGSYSAYCVQSTTPAPGPYPGTNDSRMVYGPFDLSDATAARVVFDEWWSLGAGDGIYYLTSVNGSNYYGEGYGGSSGGWYHNSIDLSNVPVAGGGVRGSRLGQSQVWLMIRFTSDASGSGEGAYVDNVVISKDYVGPNDPVIAGISPSSGSAGTGTSVTITGTKFGATQGSGGVTFYYDGVDRMSAPIMSWSDTSIVCTIPTADMSGYPGSAASGPVIVKNSGGYSSAGFPFTVTFGYGGVKWSTASASYRVNANTSDIANEKALLDAARTTWFPYSTFSLTDGGSCTSTGYPPNNSNGYNDIYWASSGMPAGALAVNYYSYFLGYFIESDIVFNDTYTWCDGAVAGQYDVQSTATHELGHSLNLRDLYGDGDASDIMYGYGGANEVKRAVTDDDQAGILWIYGPAFSGTMAVNSGAAYTNSTAVTLNSSVTASQMHFRDQGGSYGGWEAYGATKSWTLPTGDGVKTVEGQYQNASGKYFSTSDAITLDQTAPSTGNDATSNWYYSYTLHLTPSDAGSGVQQTYYRIDGGSWKTGTLATLSCWKRAGNTGSHTVEYYSSDNVGNTESTKSCTVKLDGIPPVTTSDAPLSTVPGPITVHFLPTDAHSGVAPTSTWYSVDGAAFVQGTSVMVSGAGSHTVQWYSLDNVGNVETREHRATFTLL
jgi:hypothetical protein